MKKIEIKLPNVVNFRKVYESKDGTGTMFGATCRIVDIYAARKEIETLRDINPRNQKESSAPSKAMRETLRDAQDMFVFRNRGLTFMAYDASWDNKSNELTLTFAAESNNGANGLADGGHSFDVITEFVEETDESERKDITAEVRLDIITGFQAKADEVGVIVEARNTSTQVQAYTMLNHKGLFDPVKETLKGTSYADNIAYYENERKDENDSTSDFRTIKVATILSYLMCFDMSVFTENEHPTQAYSSKRKPLKWYENKLETGREDLDALLPLLPQILELRDYIESEVPRVWNHLSGRFANQKGVRKLKKEAVLDFSGYTVDYDIPAGYVYPILAAFRAILVKEKGVYRFKTDPKKLFDQMNEDGQRSLVFKLKQAEDQDPQAMGKSQTLYDSCYGSLRGYYYEQLQK